MTKIKDPDKLATPKLKAHPGETRQQREDRHEAEQRQRDEAYEALSDREKIEYRRRAVHREDGLVHIMGLGEVLAYKAKVAPKIQFDEMDEWRVCTGRLVVPGYIGRTSPEYTCHSCHMGFVADEVTVEGDEAKAPFHAVRMHIWEVAQSRMEAAIEALGLDPHDDSIRKAIWIIQDEMRDARDSTLTSLLAAGVQKLANVLVRQSAGEVALKAVRDMDAMVINHGDHPFFTEASLYEPFGKDAGRTVLAHWRGVKEAVGA